MQGYVHRYIEKQVVADLKRKVVFVCGPRQTGKTTLAKHLCIEAGSRIEERYLNWENVNLKM